MEEIKEKVIQFMNSIMDCEAIVIFGSFARGTQTEESDIDIAIKVNGNITKKEIFEMGHLLEDELKRDIDLVNLDTIENDGFKYEILINGITIYCKNYNEFEQYKLDAYREYLELNEARRDMINEMRK